MARVQYPKKNFHLPRGRFINGSMMEKQTKDHNKQPILDPKKHRYWIAIAVDKNASNRYGVHVNDVINGIIGWTWQTYQTVAGNAAVMTQINMLLAAPAFAWKIDDGDTHPRISKMEGAKGCWVFHIGTTLDGWLSVDNNFAPIDRSAFTTGDYVEAVVSVAINGETAGTAGIFIGPEGFSLVEKGPVIVIGRDAETVFGAAAAGAPRTAAATGVFADNPPPQHSAPQVAYNPPPPPPVAAPAYAPPPPPETDEQWNVRHTGNPAPGYRFNPSTGMWDVAPIPPATPPANVQQPAAAYAAGAAPTYATGPQVSGGSPAGNGYVSAPAAPAYGQPPQVAQVAAHGSPQGTAYPSNYGPGNPPPGVQQQNYAGGPPRM